MRALFGLRGTLAGAAGAAAASLHWPAVRADSSVASVSPPSPLDPSSFRPLPLRRVEALTHDTKRYTFALPSPLDDAGCTAASVVLVSAEVPEGPGGATKTLVRPYTPTTAPGARGELELIVKVRRPLAQPFPEPIAALLSLLSLTAPLSPMAPAPARSPTAAASARTWQSWRPATPSPSRARCKSSPTSPTRGRRWACWLAALA